MEETCCLPRWAASYDCKVVGMNWWLSEVHYITAVSLHNHMSTTSPSCRELCVCQAVTSTNTLLHVHAQQVQPYWPWREKVLYRLLSNPFHWSKNPLILTWHLAFVCNDRISIHSQAKWLCSRHSFYRLQLRPEERANFLFIFTLAAKMLTLHFFIMISI